MLAGHRVPFQKAISLEVREAFSRLTGITPSEQLRWEQLIESGKTCDLPLTPNASQVRYWSGWVDVG